MLAIGPLAFTAPWLLLGLAALPLLWLILRAIPPAPVRRRFPAVALLLGLGDEDSVSARTPWWLLVLRMAALALVIIGFAGPVMNPSDRQPGSGPLLILADASWADAQDWPARQARIATLLGEAGRLGRPVALVALSDPPAAGPQFGEAEVLERGLSGFQPNPWEPGAGAADWAGALEGSFETFWLSDGLARPERGAVLAALEARGNVTVFQEPRQVLALRPVLLVDGVLTLRATRTPTGPETEAPVQVIGLDPAGVERVLAEAVLPFAAGSAEAEVELELPPELRNRLTRVELAGWRSAGGVQLAGDTLRRREVALVTGGGSDEGPELLQPLHYLRQALAPSVELVSGALGDMLAANPDAIILSDVADLPEAEAAALEEWVSNGGLLLRFAGPRLAASDISRDVENPLLPVRLRAGGRTVGGAMSWGEPKALAAFGPDSPFFGLAIPADVEVTAQVLAQPDPSLSARVIATLADGTPLVTRKVLGAGQVVLFHVTANADWSNLALSGLFVQMLERLALGSGLPGQEAAALEGTVWIPQARMDAFGRVQEVDNLPGLPGPRLTEPPGPDLPPGLYASEARSRAVNIGSDDLALAPAEWPAATRIEGLEAAAERPLAGLALGLAGALLLIDLLATMALSGRLGFRATTAALLLALPLLAPAPRAEAQEAAPPAAPPAGLSEADRFAIEATAEVRLAHVLTGDAEIDRIAAAGLFGLSNELYRRTSVEPGMPIGVNLETDDITFFPFLYWPVTTDQPLPSRAAYDKLIRYLDSGGLILFDTRDADIGGFGTGTPEGRMLQAIARPLGIPALELIPADHILTRTFYLLQDFPGRFTGRELWVEAAPAAEAAAEGMPFRNLNDGVTPVVIGGNDWAAAWAMDSRGNALLPIGRGQAGDRQRELALRFGVNLVMHVLTGNYKSDQVHVPALLERLGN